MMRLFTAVQVIAIMAMFGCRMDDDGRARRKERARHTVANLGTILTLTCSHPSQDCNDRSSSCAAVIDGVGVFVLKCDKDECDIKSVAPLGPPTAEKAPRGR